MVSGEASESIPLHIAAIAAKIPQAEIFRVFDVSINTLFNHPNAPTIDPKPALAEIRAYLGTTDTAVLFEWLGLKVDETRGLQISIHQGSTIQKIKERINQFEMTALQA